MFEINRKTIITGGAFIALLVFVYPFLRSFFSPPIRTVTMTGIGKKLIESNKAVITFTVSQNTSDRNQAITEGERKTSEVLKALASQSPTDIKKTAPQITKTNTGFEYGVGIQMSVMGRENITSVLNTLAGNDATLAQIKYFSADENSNGEEVRQMALDDARDKAQQIAKASKAKLGKVLAVSEQGSNEQTGATVTTSSSADDTSFSQIEEQSTLTVTFELK